jgi:purine-cytosine permease-like protein
VDAALMLAGCTYLLFFASNFFGPLEGFLVTLGVPLAAWAAIFITDMFLFHRKSYVERDFYRRDGVYGAWGFPGLTALIVAAVIGLGLVTSTASAFRWVGYFLAPFGGKTGAIGSSSIGILIAFVIGGALYTVLALARARARSAADQTSTAATETSTMAP